MEDLILLLTASLVLYKSNKKLTTISIGDTNCSILFPNNTEFENTRTEAGDTLYFSEHRQGKTVFGVICAQLTEPLNYENSMELLTNYMEDLRQPLYACHNTGITEVKKRRTGFIELSDFWQDDEGLDWEVKGYTNGKVVTVLYVKNIADACSEKQEAFLNSFSFGA